MYRLLIADDEPKIRNGLASLLPWADLGFTDILFAANGKEAVEQTVTFLPDLCLLDICMPLMNGLEFLSDIRQQAPDMVCIIVSGYDEFEFAKRALQLGVFDYVLKPIQEETLLGVVNKAIDQIRIQRQAKQQQLKARQFLTRNLPAMREQFLHDLITGVLSEQEVDDALSSLEIEGPAQYGLILVQLPEMMHGDVQMRIEGVVWPLQLLLMAMRNVISELLEPYGLSISMCDSFRNIIILIAAQQEMEWPATISKIQSKLAELLKVQVAISHATLDPITMAPCLYADWMDQAALELTPVVRSAQRYLEQNFADPELSIQGVADHLRISVSHLSNLFRMETGMTLVDYLTRTRIQKAVKLLEETNDKVVEIAQKVGYSRQHYFCSVFRRMMGQSPTEFRQKRQT